MLADKVFLRTFLTMLDGTIVATAIPRIASDFDALEQVVWISTAFYLVHPPLILTYGRLPCSSMALRR